MAASGKAVITTYVIQFIVILVCFILFSILRRRRSCKKFYAPRRFSKDLQRNAQPLPDTLFGWIPAVWRYKEADIIDETGLDTAVYLRVLAFGLKLFAFLSVWCLIAILPIHLVGHEIDDLEAASSSNSTVNGTDTNSTSNSSSSSSNFRFTDFDRCSLSNVAPRSQVMWVHVLTVYVVTLATGWLLYKYSKEAVLLRIIFLSNSGGDASTTVLVSDVPAVAQHSGRIVREHSRREKERIKSEKSMMKSSKSKMGGAEGDVEKGASARADEPFVTMDGIVVEFKSKREQRKKKAAGSKKNPSGDDEGAPLIANGDDVISSSSGSSDDGEGLPSRFPYDLNNEGLHPTALAKKALEAGASPAELVLQEFQAVYGKGSVREVQVLHEQKALEPLVAEYEKVCQALEDYRDEVAFLLARGKPIKERKKVLVFGALLPSEWRKERGYKWGLQKVDALEHWSARLQWLKSEIGRERANCMRAVAPAAFVTFSSRLAQAQASGSLHHHSEKKWRPVSAPLPDELIWRNTPLTTPMRSSASSVMWVVFWLMAMFFMVPVLFIQAMIEVPKLADNPVLGPIVTFPVVKVLLEAIVPGLALKIFLAIVPTLLTIMVIKSGAVSNYQVDFGVVSRYFIFQLIVVFFGNTVGGSFFNQLKEWVNNPTSVLSILGTAIPMSATFFITFVAVNGGTAKPLGLLRAVPLVLFQVFSKLSSSPEARRRLWMFQYTTYGTTVVDHLMATLLGLVFCCINPIICPTVLMYFVITLTVERYNTVHVYRRQYESAGELWKTVVNSALTALYIFQLVMIGLISIKKFPYSVIIIPVLPLTLVFHIVVLKSFKRPWTLLSLHDAAELDRRQRKAARHHRRQARQQAAAARTKAVAAAAASGDADRDTAALPLLQGAGGEGGQEGAGETTTYAVPEAAKPQYVGGAYVQPVFKVLPEDFERALAVARELGPRVDQAVEETAARLAAEKAAGKKSGGCCGGGGGDKADNGDVSDGESDQDVPAGPDGKDVEKGESLPAAGAVQMTAAAVPAEAPAAAAPPGAGPALPVHSSGVQGRATTSSGGGAPSLPPPPLAVPMLRQALAGATAGDGATANPAAGDATAATATSGHQPDPSLDPSGSRRFSEVYGLPGGILSPAAADRQ